MSPGSSSASDPEVVGIPTTSCGETMGARFEEPSGGVSTSRAFSGATASGGWFCSRASRSATSPSWGSGSLKIASQSSKSAAASTALPFSGHRRMASAHCLAARYCSGGMDSQLVASSLARAAVLTPESLLGNCRQAASLPEISSPAAALTSGSSLTSPWTSGRIAESPNSPSSRAIAFACSGVWAANSSFPSCSAWDRVVHPWVRSKSWNASRPPASASKMIQARA